MLKMDSLIITTEMLNLIGEVDEFKGAWRALRTLAPERLARLRRVATIESVGSSTRIEGAKLTDKEVEILLGRLEHQSFCSRDEEEVAGYAALMETIFTSWENIPLSESHIQQLHGILLRYSSKDERHRGIYKTLPNHVEAFGPDGNSLGIIFETATPFETPFHMAELVAWTREHLDNKLFHPLLVIAVFIVSFLAIHPFQDGNGRLSRAMTTFLLLKTGYVYAPYSSLESIIEENKESYYLALRQTQGTLKNDKPNWEYWLLFFLRSVQKQKRRLEERLAREKMLSERSLPELSIKILELLQKHERLKMAELENQTREHRNTIKLRINDLIKRGLIERHGNGPGTWYTLSG